MSNAPWRARREAYLRDCGRTADLVREGFAVTAFEVIEGGGRRVPRPKVPLRLILPITCSAEHASNQELVPPLPACLGSPIARE